MALPAEVQRPERQPVSLHHARNQLKITTLHRNQTQGTHHSRYTGCPFYRVTEHRSSQRDVRGTQAL